MLYDYDVFNVLIVITLTVMTFIGGSSLYIDCGVEFGLTQLYGQIFLI